MDPNGPRSSSCTLLARISSRFTFMCKGVLVIMEDYIGVSEKDL